MGNYFKKAYEIGKKNKWLLTTIVAVLAFLQPWIQTAIHRANLSLATAKEEREANPKAKLVLHLGMGDPDGFFVGSANLIDLEAENTLNRFKDLVALRTICSEFGPRLVKMGFLTEEKFREGEARANVLEADLSGTEVGVPINLSISNNREIDTTITEVSFELKSVNGGEHRTTISGSKARIEVPAGKTIDFEGDLFRYFRIHLARLSPILMDTFFSTLGEGTNPIKRALIEKEGHVFWDNSSPLKIIVVDQFGTEQRAEISGKDVEALIKKAFRIDKSPVPSGLLKEPK